MAAVNRYRVYCTTDSKHEYQWAETEPTTCPVNTGHSIDSAKTAIVQIMADNEVVIQEEQTKTGAHYQAQSFELSVPASTGWHELNISFPFPISMLSAEWIGKTDYDGDSAQFIIAPDTTTGAIASDVAALDTVINVAQSVIDNTQVGYHLKLDDGTNVDDLGRVVSIDDGANQVTMETAAVNSFLAATPTYVKQTVKMVPHICLHPSGRVQLGESKIGGSYIPANTVIRLRYNNLTGTAKTFSVIIEYLY